MGFIDERLLPSHSATYATLRRNDAGVPNGNVAPDLRGGTPGRSSGATFPSTFDGQRGA
jgi:hypothetical protein